MILTFKLKKFQLKHRLLYIMMLKICINQKSRMKKLKFSKKNIKIYNFLTSKKKDIKILKV